MKKIMSLMLGLSLVLGAATMAFGGQDTSTSTKKSTKKSSTKKSSTKNSTKSTS